MARITWVKPRNDCAIVSDVEPAFFAEAIAEALPKWADSIDKYLAKVYYGPDERHWSATPHREFWAGCVYGLGFCVCFRAFY